MEPGVYILLLSGEITSLKIGSLGMVSFTSGFYCYVGSALGSGGLARVTRHIRVAAHGGKKPRWHIDHLLMSPAFRLNRVYCAPTSERLECPLAQALSLAIIPGFGSSDCQCIGHLFYSAHDPHPSILNGFEAVALQPAIRIL